MFYTCCSMMQARLKFLLPVLALPLLLTGLFAVENSFQAGEILDVQQKTRSIILYYLVNSPVSREEPYFEVSVQLKSTIYLGQYTPRHGAETLPDDWKPGGAVEARVEGHHLILQTPESTELKFLIVKHFEVAPKPAAAR